MLRGVNVGAHNRVKMDALRSLFESLKLETPRTYVQSGNVVFRTKERSASQLAQKIQSGVERKFGFRPDVILRRSDELRRAIASSPFVKRTDLEPGKILITFLAAEPGPEVPAKLASLTQYPEEFHLKGREFYIYFPNGAGKSKLPWSQVERLLKVTGTARNLNSVTSMLQIAEEMESER